MITDKRKDELVRKARLLTGQFVKLDADSCTIDEHPDEESDFIRTEMHRIGDALLVLAKKR